MKRWKGEMQYCVSRKRPLDGACLGRQLDGSAVKQFFFGGFYPRSRIVFDYDIGYRQDGFASAAGDCRDPG